MAIVVLRMVCRGLGQASEMLGTSVASRRCQLLIMKWREQAPRVRGARCAEGGQGHAKMQCPAVVPIYVPVVWVCSLAMVGGAASGSGGVAVVHLLCYRDVARGL